MSNQSLNQTCPGTFDMAGNTWLQLEEKNMIKTLLSTFMFFFAAINVMAADGMINVPSNFGVKETADRMEIHHGTQGTHNGLPERSLDREVADG